MKKTLLMCCLFIGLIAAGNAQPKPAIVTDPAGKAKGLQKELKLSDDQTAKITAIYKESAAKFDKIKEKEHGVTNKMLPQIAPLRKATVAKIKTVLTPAQIVKYDKLIKGSDKAVTNGGWSDGWSSAAGS